MTSEISKLQVVRAVGLIVGLFADVAPKVLEVGRAQRAMFVARFLRSRELQREITEGLNIVEAFNCANSVV